MTRLKSSANACAIRSPRLTSTECGPTHNETRRVRVRYGPNDMHLEVSGMTVGNLKPKLREVFNIPYFVGSWLNGRPVDAQEVLVSGDILEFSRCFGVKGSGGDDSGDARIAEYLLAADPRLRQIAENVKAECLSPEASADRTLTYVKEYLTQQFGAPGAKETSVVHEIVRRLVAADFGVGTTREGERPEPIQSGLQFDAAAGSVYIDGKLKTGMTWKQEEVVQTLWEAGERGMSKRELTKKAAIPMP